MKKENKKITKKMTFNEILQKNPESVMILLEKGMHCIGCGMAGFETLEQGALAHGINPDELVKELNNEKKNKTEIKTKVKKKKR
jgi:hybrid cluster-associated redox disulfide protein